MRWEYKTEVIECAFTFASKLKIKIEDLCNKLGEDGWELVNFRHIDNDTCCLLVFKRSY